MRSRIEYVETIASDSRAVAKLFSIPQTVLAAWQLEGFIGRVTVTQEQWERLNMIRCVIWDNRKVIRAMLATLPRSERRRLIDSCEKTTIERIVYLDFLRVKLTGRGLMNDDRQITFCRYQKYLAWRHPHLCHLLTLKIFEKQRKSAEARIRYCRQHGTLDRLITDHGLKILEDGSITNPWISDEPTKTDSGKNIFYD